MNLGLTAAEVIGEQRQRRERQRRGENELSAVAHEVAEYSRAEPAVCHLPLYRLLFANSTAFCHQSPCRIFGWAAVHFR